MINYSVTIPCCDIKLIFKQDFKANISNYVCYGIAGQCGESGMVNFDKFFGANSNNLKHGPVGKLMDVDHSNFSDSNSEVSVSESVATNRAKITISGENENVGGVKINMSFIDFLGVGATI